VVVVVVHVLHFNAGIKGVGSCTLMVGLVVTLEKVVQGRCCMMMMGTKCGGELKVVLPQIVIFEQRQREAVVTVDVDMVCTFVEQGVRILWELLYQ